ncbi:hypothetical protein MTO96_010233 [Rhipicephalus appendiculatus]
MIVDSEGQRVGGQDECRDDDFSSGAAEESYAISSVNLPEKTHGLDMEKGLALGEEDNARTALPTSASFGSHMLPSDCVTGKPVRYPAVGAEATRPKSPKKKLTPRPYAKRSRSAQTLPCSPAFLYVERKRCRRREHALKAKK